MPHTIYPKLTVLRVAIWCLVICVTFSSGYVLVSIIEAVEGSDFWRAVSTGKRPLVLTITASCSETR